MRGKLHSILKELENNIEFIQEDQMLELIERIQKSNHIFLTGKGRSGLSISAFANRLLHLGYSVSLIGEISAPHTQDGDLLIIASGSGETDALVSAAKKAKSENVSLVCLTMNRESTIAKLSDLTILIPGVSPKVKEMATISSIQPMGSAFEQMVFLAMDALILQMMERENKTSERMFLNHANIE